MAGLAGIHEMLGGLVVIAFVVVALLAAIAAAGRDMRWVRTSSFVAAGLLAVQYLLGLLLLGNGFRNSTTHYVIGLLVLVPVALQHTSGRRLSERVHGVALMNGGYGKYSYPPDRTSDPRVKAYVEDQEELRLKLLDDLRGVDADP